MFLVASPIKSRFMAQCAKNMLHIFQPDLIRKNGYPVEKHKVTTKDGYILTLHRIPYGKKSPAKEGVTRPALLLQHGILSSSADWVMAIPEKSLGICHGLLGHVRE